MTLANTDEVSQCQDAEEADHHDWNERDEQFGCIDLQGRCGTRQWAAPRQQIGHARSKNHHASERQGSSHRRLNKGSIAVTVIM